MSNSKRSGLVGTQNMIVFSNLYDVACECKSKRFADFFFFEQSEVKGSEKILTIIINKNILTPN